MTAATNNTAAALTPDQIAQRAASAFMQMQMQIGTWDGIKLNKSATAAAAAHAGANPEAARLSVYLLGTHHARLKEVKAAYTAVRQHFYDHSRPYSDTAEGAQQKGARIIPCDQVAPVYTRLQQLARAAEQARDAFLTDYEQYATHARAYDLGELQEGISYPSAEELRSRFYIQLQPPAPLSIPTADQMPAALGPLAAEIAAQHADRALRMLSTARAETLEAAREHAERVRQQLTTGKRLHASLLSATITHADMLEAIARGTDNDPALIEAARMLREQVANVQTVEQWKNSENRKQEAAAAATKVAAVLTDTQRQTPTLAAAPATAADVALGGMLGGML